ncbi:MAG: right-handed parallel beta-helix repeat-containing protein [Planctomycetes bacterium]|nr:right-handed parallel beta-helix repeat-containing protein [Planctomycetota bacterium]
MLGRGILPWLVSLTGLIAGQAAAEVIFVDAAANGANDGTGWADAFTDLQDGLGSAVSGDEVWVAAGTYKPTQPDGDRLASFVLTNGVALYGGFAGGESELDERDWEVNETVLSGDLNGDDGDDFENNEENTYHVVAAISTTETVVLDGFVITAGNTAKTGDRDVEGGGIVIEIGSAIVSNCTFMANSSGQGALYGFFSNVTLTNCAFIENIGGAIFGLVADMTLTDCSFFDNTHGAINNILAETTILTDCIFVNNSDLFFLIVPKGGAVELSGDATLTRCTFVGNSAAGVCGGAGGALYWSSDDSDISLTDCVFLGNLTDTGQGGGLAAGGAVALGGNGNATLINCLFSGNFSGTGAGIKVTEGTTLTNCTFSGNSAYFSGGAIGGASPTLTNCLLWGNSDLGGMDESGQIDADDPIINYCNIQGWTGDFGGVGNLGMDPLFADADGPDDTLGTEDDDLHLLSGSPSIDAGDNNALPVEVTADLDGNPRYVDDPATEDTGNPGAPGPPIIDMGAYEFQVEAAPCEGDVNGDGTVNPLDSGFVLARYGCPVNTGDPSCDDADVNYDGMVDPLDSGYVLARFGECP